MTKPVSTAILSSFNLSVTVCLAEEVALLSVMPPGQPYSAGGSNPKSSVAASFGAAREFYYLEARLEPSRTFWEDLPLVPGLETEITTAWRSASG